MNRFNRKAMSARFALIDLMHQKNLSNERRQRLASIAMDGLDNDDVNDSGVDNTANGELIKFLASKLDPADFAKVKEMLGVALEENDQMIGLDQRPSGMASTDFNKRFPGAARIGQSW
jgi:hypothetical protein